MVKQFTILDAWTAWNAPAAEAAARRGYDAKIISSGAEASGRAGLGFIRPHAAPRKDVSLHDDMLMRWQPGMQMVQDRSQLEVFENKGEQFARWGRFMPQTVRLRTRDEARRFTDSIAVTSAWVSKADEGASSSNIRILKGRNAVRQHIDLVFRRGIRVRHCGGHATMQRNYVMLQHFIPHTMTWRVNRVGNYYAVFQRFNNAQGLAQTGNVRPVMDLLEPGLTDVLRFAEEITDGALDTRWVALDILLEDGKPYLLETSLGWPWPSPGNCDDNHFFRHDTLWCDDHRYQWRDMWELMLDSYEAGVFNGR